MWDLFRVEFKRSWLTFTRYPVEAVGAILSLSLIFYGLFVGARYMAGPGVEFGERLEAILVGYLTWTLLIFAYSGLSFALTQEAETGTLEQLFLTPYGPLRLFLVRSLAGLLVQLLLMLFVGALLALLTGVRLRLSPALLLPLAAVLMAGYGLGFAVGGLALIFKRVQQLIGLSQFLLLFLVLAPFEEGRAALLAHLLPAATGAGLLRDLAAREVGLDWGRLGLAFLNGAFYLGLGLYLFQKAVRLAKARGLLSGY
jgi:ABC-2 type transport system permease protein